MVVDDDAAVVHDLRAAGYQVLHATWMDGGTDGWTAPRPGVAVRGPGARRPHLTTADAPALAATAPGQYGWRSGRSVQAWYACRPYAAPSCSIGMRRWSRGRTKSSY